jgi:hypothetical protein
MMNRKFMGQWASAVVGIALIDIALFVRGKKRLMRSSSVDRCPPSIKADKLYKPARPVSDRWTPKCCHNELYCA